MKKLIVEARRSDIPKMTKYQTDLTLLQLDKHTFTEYYDPITGEGMQRFHGDRDKTYCKALEDGYREPTEILLGCVNGDCSFKLDKGKKTSGVLTVTNNLFVIDGGTRRDGDLGALLKLGPAHKVSVGIMEASETEIIEWFIAINRYRRNVTLDHIGTQIIRKIKNMGGDVNTVNRKELKTALAVDVLRNMDRIKTSPFYDRFSLPNKMDDKARYIPPTTQWEMKNNNSGIDFNKNSILLSSWRNKMEDICIWLKETEFKKTKKFGSLSQKITTLVLNYFTAIKELNPKSMGDTSSFVIQRRIGAFILIPVLKSSIAKLKENGKLYTKANFKKLLDKSLTLKSKTKWKMTVIKRGTKKTEKPIFWSKGGELFGAKKSDYTKFANKIRKEMNCL